MPSNPEMRIQRHILLWIVGITLLSVGSYLVFSGIYYRIGFPLDDAWIHQTYARNLGTHGEWSFLPGKISGGSTSPLWSILLAIGYPLGLMPYSWTYILGAAILFGLALVSELAMRQWEPSYHPKFPWVGIVLALEWHLVWSSASGMETILFAFLVTISLLQIISGSTHYFKIGLLIGLSVWVRPDGLTLLGPLVVAILLRRSTWSIRLRGLFKVGLGFGALFTFYLLFNLAISGTPFPNTFYAKQAEYADLLKAPFALRLGSELFPMIKGIGLILLPGFVYSIVAIVRKRDWGSLAVVIWLSGFIILYAWRLPVTYQYGRYIMPAMPIFFLLGLVGLINLTSRRDSRWRWFLSTSWRLVAGGILAAFWVVGAFRYARDVAFIESEMVATAKWVSVNVPATELIAVHDIGALGYFGGHDLVDLAGLVSPDLILYIRNEEWISDYLTRRGVTYLVVFPDWYQHLTIGLEPVYTTGSPYSQEAGGVNMTVFRWPGR
jgi:hypothetical protein